MKKALIVTTVSGFVPQFEMNNVRLLQERGYEVHYAANYNTPVYGDNSRLEGTGIIRHQVDFVKSPFSLSNIKVYRQLNAVVKELSRDGELKIIHCHTPMGGAMARLVGKGLRKDGTKIIYTAHGFHFFKGADKLNWLVYYTAEKWLSRYTDVLITINREDHRAAKSFHMKKLAYIPGVGMDLEKIEAIPCEREAVRNELGLSGDDYCLASVGELSDRKNHRIVIEAMAEIPDKNIKYVICGSGANDAMLKELAKTLGVDKKVIFAGYRTDAVRVLKAMDAFVFPSLQEGLPVALMEAMAAGLPVIASKIRGNEDLVDSTSGILVPSSDKASYVAAIKTISSYTDEQLSGVREHNKLVLGNFTLEKVEKIMKKVYNYAER